MYVYYHAKTGTFLSLKISHQICKIKKSFKILINLIVRTFLLVAQFVFLR